MSDFYLGVPLWVRDDHDAAFPEADPVAATRNAMSEGSDWMQRFALELTRGDGAAAMMGDDDRLVGDDGDNRLSAWGVQRDLIGGNGDDTLQGQNGTDTIRGGAGDDWIKCGAGDDTIRGGGGDDTVQGGVDDNVIDGGRGNDELGGRTGNDTMLGGSGDDTLRGGKGDDRLEGGSGNDRLKGDVGEDTFVFSDGFDSDLIIRFDVHDDELHIDAELLDGEMTGQEIVDTYGSTDGRDLVLDFGDGDVIRFDGLAAGGVTLDDLAGLILII